MTINNLQDFKRRIIDAYDAEYIVDILRIDAVELLDAFEDKLLENLEAFSELEDEDNDDE